MKRSVPMIAYQASLAIGLRVGDRLPVDLKRKTPASEAARRSHAGYHRRFHDESLNEHWFSDIVHAKNIINDSPTFSTELSDAVRVCGTVAKREIRQ